VDNYTTKSYKIRKLDIRFDQPAVADLIETTFGEYIDPDGKNYLQRIRQAARDRKSVQWLQGANEMASYPLYGFVCVTEHGDIIGNISLIPFERHSRWIYLIANVAVAEAWRGKGIAKDLTTTVLTHLSQHGVQSVWLQVREDNEAAINLYQSFGFKEFSRRTTWIKTRDIGADSMSTHSEITVEKRNAKHWLQHAQLLHRIYPQDVAWNLSLHIQDFAPGILPVVISSFFFNDLEHYVAKRNHQVIGFASWQSRKLFADTIWLALYPEDEERATGPLLNLLEKNLRNKNKPVTINYPAHRNTHAFSASGYNEANTLIWMKRPIWKTEESGGE
jgi:ribosomal protein S18 acetylase RimI-like enzyme